MKDSLYNANCDLVFEMEEAGISVEEILQYAHGVLSDTELKTLLRGIQNLISTKIDENTPEDLEACSQLDELALL